MTKLALAFVLIGLPLTGCSKGAAPRPERAQETSAAPTASGSSIIFRSPDGRVLAVSDLANVDGPVKWELLGDQQVPEKAMRLHEEGRAAGARGDFDGALRLLDEAAKLAPTWPYPVYDAAFTYLLKGDDNKAREYYDKTLRLAPRGFFTAITAAQYLRQEAAGRLPRGTYLQFVRLEWAEIPAERLAATQKLVAAVPGFAPAWKELQVQLEDPTGRLDAIAKGLAADPDPETKGFLLINKALVLNLTGKEHEARDLLGAVALDRASPPDVEQSAKQALAMMFKQRQAR
jgi:tetratricopeptide (TPR) repeat protein